MIENKITEKIESLHPNQMYQLMKNTPLFTRNELKSYDFIEKTRKDFLNFSLKNNANNLNEQWQNFCLISAKEKINNLGKEIKDKSLRSATKTKLERFISKEPQNTHVISF